MRVLFAPGLLKYSDYLEIMQDLNNTQIVGVLLRNNKFPDWLPEKTGLPTWTYRELYDVKLNLEHTPYHKYYEQILTHLLEDSRTFYLVERIFRGEGLGSVFNNMIKVEHIIWNSLSILYSTKPQRLVANSTPHNALWFIAKVAEYLEIDIYLTPTSPLRWKKWVVKGMDKQIPIQIINGDNSQQKKDNLEVKNFISNIRSSYLDAIPDFEKEAMIKYNNKLIGFKYDFLSIFNTNSFRGLLTNIYTTILKYNTHKAYRAHSKNFYFPSKYIVFFLHFQPEKTTLPEGYKFVQQWLAIRTLIEAIPHDWYLIVKEHPSMFKTLNKKKFNPNMRDSDLYDAVNALPNAMLAPLDISSDQLIDNSMAVSTITGKVGHEALIRGKPVIVFGVAPYIGAKGVFFVQSIQDVKLVVEKMGSESIIPTDEELLQYFIWVDNNSFMTNTRFNGSIDAYKIALTIGENET